ncbi:MAG TPA: tetratricopeptide repeat protein [Burkholderiaceae bacterium]|nr:tetratricopeptide repeat protein [Burkholderiaceae bacterium]
MNGSGFTYQWLKLSAMAWLLIGRPQQAETVFDEMLRRWPQDGYALASRAHVRAQSARGDEAIADLRELLAAQPERSAADWFNLAYLLEEAGRYADAEDAFRRALALDPKLDRAWYGLGLVLIRLQRTDDAIAALKKNTELQPMSPYGWYQLARVRFERSEAEEARKIIRHLKGFEPKVAAQLERETGLVA